MEETAIIESLMNNLSKGLIYVDKNGVICMCNQKAREITGMKVNVDYSHPKGRLESGDIVIIADNKLGEDDGDLGIKELGYIGINDEGIRQKDTLLAIGIYGNSEIKPIYKFVRENRLNMSLVLEKVYLGLKISVTLEPIKKSMVICVNDQCYEQVFINSFGHMVVIGGLDGQLKFVQSSGYSVRKEAIGDLLRGKSFLGKCNDSLEDFPIVGKKVLEVFEKNPFIDKVFKLLKGEDILIKDSLEEINKRPFVCSLIPLKQGDYTKGLFMIFQDVLELEILLEERNRLIESIEKRQQSLAFDKDFPKGAFERFIGNSQEMERVKHLAFRASKAKFNVVLTGESGTGKTQLAREIHRLSNLKGSFVEVNCNAIVPTLFESELFGYVGGAFTGALPMGKLGYFKEADKGTLFLDEIGELPLEIQSKLLHAIQNKIIYPVGSSKAITVDVRIIVATNKDLEIEVSRGLFRQDLYYRLNVFPINIPPLRSRKDDIYMLTNKMVQDICESYDEGLKKLSGEAFNKLLSYNWPGNIRELENILERAIALCETLTIYSEHINIMDKDRQSTLKDLLQLEEKRILKEGLRVFGSNKTELAEILDISKSALYEKLKKYELLS